MTHSYESNSGAYWAKALSVVIGLSVLAVLPGFLPTSESPLGFQIMITAIAVLSFVTFIYVRPKDFNVTILDKVVEIRGGDQRILFACDLKNLDEMGLSRWGHVLGYPIGWITLKPSGAKKTRFFGAISGLNFDTEKYTALERDFIDMKERLELNSEN